MARSVLKGYNTMKSFPATTRALMPAAHAFEPLLRLEAVVDGMHDHGLAVVGDGGRHAYNGGVVDAQSLEDARTRRPINPS